MTDWNVSLDIGLGLAFVGISFNRSDVASMISGTFLRQRMLRINLIPFVSIRITWITEDE